MPWPKKSPPWETLTEEEKIRRLVGWHEGTRSRIVQYELDLLEIERRLRMLFRELGLQERRLRPFVRDLEGEEVAQLELDPAAVAATRKEDTVHLTYDHPAWPEFAHAMEARPSPCDGSHKHTIAALQAIGADEDASLAWLENQGGRCCDCEVLSNVVLEAPAKKTTDPVQETG